MDCAPLARRFLWVSSALALLPAALVLWARRRQPPTLSLLRHRWLLWLAGALAAAWGVLGAALAASDSCARVAERALVTLVAVVAVASLLGALALLAMSALVSAQAAAPPGHETPLAIVCLRCSCCSDALKRLLLLLPVALLAAANGVLWRQSGALSGEEVPTCDTSRAAAFFAGATAIFACGALVQLVSFYCSRSGRSDAPSSPPASPVAAATLASSLSQSVGCCPPRSTRRRKRLAVFSALLALSVASLVWAAIGCAWLSGAASSACTAPQRGVWASVEASVVVLFLLGWTLLTLTLCCRLEDVILATADLPSVDPSALSPKLCRSPRKPTTESEAAPVTMLPSKQQQGHHTHAPAATPTTFV